MRTKAALSTLAPLIVILLSLLAAAQDSAQSSGSEMKDQQSTAGGQTSGEPEGVKWGDYNVSQEVNLGFRWSSPKGNGRLYNTLVNLHQGFRVLDQTLAAHSLNHTGLLFDNLYISSFGWNGDPNNAARWSVSKNKAYNFTGTWRRDQNFFDYDLLANPLNPPSTSPGYPNANINFSPHSMELRRRMLDTWLTLLPQSPISIRLGYIRNNMTGPSFSSFHEGTDVLLAQPWNTTLNGYRIGIDVKVLPQTTISYDQYLDYFRNDTDWTLAPFPLNPRTGQLFVTTGDVATGVPSVPVVLGLPFNVPARQPCAAPFSPATADTVNPGCSAYQTYSRIHRYRSKQPTEQLTLQSNHFRRLEFLGRVTYSSNDMTDPLTESMRGTVIRTGVNERGFDITGHSDARRLSAQIDLAATIHISDTWRVPITFRSVNLRNAGAFDSTETVFSPTTPAELGGPLGVGVATSDLINLFFGWKDKRLEADVEHDFTKAFGARIGARWNRRDVNGRDFSEDLPDITRTNEYTGLAGFWFRPNHEFRANFDAEFGSADNFLFRIIPRNQQRYRARMTYTPKPWAIATAYLNFWEARNEDSAIQYHGHNRNFGVTLNLTPNPRFGIDLGYNYNAFVQNSIICFVGSTLPPGTVAPPAGSPCATAESGSLTALVRGDYSDRIHFFTTSWYFRPVSRATINVGYSLDHSDGHFTQLNLLQPLGNLGADYHFPLANLAIDLHKNLTWNLGWNYWDYRENDVGPTLPRNMHANVGTTSLRFAF